MLKIFVILGLCLSLSLLAEQDPFIPTISTQASVIPLHYIQAEDVAKIINKQWPNCQTNALKADNTLILNCDGTNPNNIVTIIHQLDQPQPQFRIKVRIISMDQKALRQFGLSLLTQQTSNESGYTVNLPVSTSENSAIIPIAHLLDNAWLALHINLLAETGNAKIITSPELMTSNNKSATIESGEAIPYQAQTNNGNTSVAFKQAALKVTVTPTLLPNHKILLSLDIHQDKVSSLTVQGVPAISTQHLHTVIFTRDQQTTVLGGIYETLQSQQNASWPILSQIPLLGKLFSNKSQQHERKQLLIFVTPSIVR